MIQGIHYILSKDMILEARGARNDNLVKGQAIADFQAKHHLFFEK